MLSSPLTFLCSLLSAPLSAGCICYPLLFSSILHPPSSILVFAAAADYVPFIYPFPDIWNYWPWLILPLCAGVSIIYKSVKCQSMRSVPREALIIFVWIVLGMAAAGVALAGVARIVIER